MAMGWGGYRARRIRAVLLALSVGIGLTSCRAVGGGQLAAGSDRLGDHQARATFGFTFTCQLQQGRPVIRGHLTYRDDGPSTVTDRGTFSAVALEGDVQPIAFLDAQTCEDANELVLGAAQFEGQYRPLRQDKAPGTDPAAPSAQPGTFTVLVFDQRDPGHSIGDSTGDGFAIELFGGRYDGYTRSGYLLRGNIQVMP